MAGHGFPGPGPLWGTVRLEFYEGGVWEGTWTGEREVTSDGALSTLHFVMSASDGRIDGLKSKWEIIAPHTGESTFTGRILEPGGK